MFAKTWGRSPYLAWKQNDPVGQACGIFESHRLGGCTAFKLLLAIDLRRLSEVDGESSDLAPGLLAPGTSWLAVTFRPRSDATQFAV